MITNIATTTTYFVGAYYEVANGVVTKYYYAGSQRIAMRTNGDLKFLLGNHLGSTSLTTDSNAIVISELRYKAWGEIRYESGTTPTKYTYTGQYSNTADFGLMFYNARWVDVSLGRFAQADTVVSGGVQGYDRYAYVINSPVRFSDPSGHIGCDEDVKGNCINYEYKKFTDKDIEKTIVHIGFGWMTWARDGDAEPKAHMIATGLATPIVDRQTLITANHVYGDAQNNKSQTHPLQYMFMWGPGQPPNPDDDYRPKNFIPISLSSLNLDPLDSDPNDDDQLIISLPKTVSVPKEFLVANVAINYTAKPLQPISVAYQDEQRNSHIYNTRMLIVDPVQTHIQWGQMYAAYNISGLLDRGDSGGGVFYEGGLIGVNSALAGSGYAIQPLVP